MQKKKFAKTEKAFLFLLEKVFELGSLPFEVFDQATAHGGFGKRTLGSALSGVRKRGYVKTIRKHHAQSPMLVLTPKGNLRILLERCKLLQSEERKPWDKKWRIIIFDIPERLRAHRDFLRRHLVSFGFAKLHKSVWITPRRISPELIQLLWEMRIKIYTRCMVVEHMDYDKDLLKKFELLHESSKRISEFVT
ncbi:MAG: hypothetical protein Q7S09_05590 [bacterium]|nr:hypothetical protein [bacterium]